MMHKALHIGDNIDYICREKEEEDARALGIV